MNFTEYQARTIGYQIRNESRKNHYDLSIVLAIDILHRQYFVAEFNLFASDSLSVCVE